MEIIRFIFRNLKVAFQGCEKDPVPINLFKRLKWYSYRLLALFILFKLMSEYEDKKEDRNTDK